MNDVIAAVANKNRAPNLPSKSPATMLWESTLVGDAIPTFTRTTDLSHWNHYAAVNNEFIPIHMDTESAQAIGQPDVFGMGNLRLAYLHNVLHDWLAGRGDIVDISCQFRGMNFKGDQLQVKGVVTAKREQAGQRYMDLTLSVINQRGEDITPATAVVILFETGEGCYPSTPEPLTTTAQPQPGRYLDQKIIAWLGRSTAPIVALPVGENDIRRWAQSTYYPQRVPMEFYDNNLAALGPWKGLVAPRDFNPFAWVLDVDESKSEPWLRGMGVEPGSRVLNGGQRTRYFAPIRAGDFITSVATLAEAYEREGKLGTMLFLVNETRWTNQRGELVRVGNRTTIYY